MSGRQLRLLPAPQPLVERLGTGWFRGLPRAPGVYRMFGADGRLLYVGQSGNLRDRLSSYRRTHGQPRRTVRLLHAAFRVEIEVLPSVDDARRMEARLLRSLRPPFNRAGTWPDSARGATWSPVNGGWELAVTDGRAADAFGTFRGPLAQTLGTLAGWIWLAGRGSADPARLPARFTAGRRWHLDDRSAAGRHAGAIRSWLAGESTEVIAALAEEMGPPPHAFAAAWMADGGQRLAEFFERWPARVRRLRERHRDLPRPIPPGELDDLLLTVDSRPAAGPATEDPACPKV